VGGNYICATSWAIFYTDHELSSSLTSISWWFLPSGITLLRMMCVCVYRKNKIIAKISTRLFRQKSLSTNDLTKKFKVQSLKTNIISNLLILYLSIQWKNSKILWVSCEISRHRTFTSKLLDERIQQQPSLIPLSGVGYMDQITP
jgi:hypothetical protein